MTTTDYPLHGPGRAVLPHPARASGKDAHASKRIRMADASGRQIAMDQPFHSFPENSPLLAAMTERAMPKAGDLETEQQQGRSIHRHTVVLEVSPEYTAQPLADFRNGIVHPSLEFGFDFPQFACSLDRWVCRRTVNIPLERLLPQIWVKPKKLNVSGFPYPRPRRLRSAKGPPVTIDNNPGSCPNPLNALSASVDCANPEEVFPSQVLVYSMRDPDNPERRWTALCKDLVTLGEYPAPSSFSLTCLSLTPWRQY
jgi:hypothetical protein